MLKAQLLPFRIALNAITEHATCTVVSRLYFPSKKRSLTLLTLSHSDRSGRLSRLSSSASVPQLGRSSRSRGSAGSASRSSSVRRQSCLRLAYLATFQSLTPLRTLLTAAVFIVVIACGVSDRPPAAPPGPFDKKLRAFNNPSFTDAMVAVVNILFAYCGTPGFFSVIAEMKVCRSRPVSCG
jgi:hypothetical protein